MWVKLDDCFPDWPEIGRIGPGAAWLHVAALCYSNRNLTDGFIPVQFVGKLTTIRRPFDAVQALTREGMWKEVEGGYQLIANMRDQPTRADMERKRAQDAQRQRRHRSQESRCESRVTSSVSHSAPSRPVPGIESIQESPPGGVGGIGRNGSGGRPPGGGKGKSGEAAKIKPDLSDPAIDEVWAHYKRRVQPGKRICPREAIAERLRTFSVGQLKSAIDHFADDAFYGGTQRHRGAALLFCRSDGKTEEFIDLLPRRTLESPGRRRPEDSGSRYELVN